MKKALLLLLSAVTLSISLSFTSCSSDIIGYSTVLWNIQGENKGKKISIADGTLVKVYLKSHINNVYVIGVPDSKVKLEIPLWKISEPESKSDARKSAKKYKKYNHQYARCVFDGLPIRDAALNTSKQVYRLRKDEIVRVLYEGSGVAPTTGKQKLEGKWLAVLTSEGTRGWCFSYNLRLFTMNADGSFGSGAEDAQVQETDETLNTMLQTRWYPEYYSSMIKSKDINLDGMQPNYGFDTGLDTGTVSMNLPGLTVSAEYKGVTKKSSNVYKFNEAPFQVTVRNAKTIIVQYTNEKGTPRSYNFTTLEEGVRITALIADERTRRTNLFKTIRSAGPDFRSSNYGTLTFEANNEFTWTDYDLLVPSYIPSSAEGRGTVSFKYFVPQSLKKSYDCVMTLTFTGAEKELSFLVKKEANGIRLTLANVTKIESALYDAASISVPSNPLVLFFQN
ncbi:SH3 domain-containing protein [Treponema sp.]|uniref:SH3 domain-containing protein n=1 Tax=Treponema sp. TaxID=166 RepID=UPI0025FEAB4E|nr:SH3 domain-containing protein [Treponema sp.]MCR5218141.1 SH3 domain-containing protein [Treponema sp.]